MSSVDIFGAVYRRDRELIRQLTSNGVGINTLDEDGRSALMHAILAEDADLDVIETLIDCDADVNIQDRVARWTALHFAAQAQRSDLVKTLLNAGARVDVVDAYGNTALWRAVMNNSPNSDLISLLLMKGADPEHKNKHDVSAIDTAKNMGNQDLIELLTSGEK